MKKILVITHGNLCEGLKSSMEVIMGDSSMIDTISVTVSDSPQTIQDKIQAYIDATAIQTPIFILTDIPAGSTTTVSAPYMLARANIYIISGLNLGMLLAIAMQNVEEGDIKANIKDILEEAKSTIMFVNDQLQQ